MRVKKTKKKSINSKKITKNIKKSNYRKRTIRRKRRLKISKKQQKTKSLDGGKHPYLSDTHIRHMRTFIKKFIDINENDLDKLIEEYVPYDLSDRIKSKRQSDEQGNEQRNDKRNEQRNEQRNDQLNQPTDIEYDDWDNIETTINQALKSYLERLNYVIDFYDGINLRGSKLYVGIKNEEEFPIFDPTSSNELLLTITEPGQQVYNFVYTDLSYVKNQQFISSSNAIFPKIMYRKVDGASGNHFFIFIVKGDNVSVIGDFVAELNGKFTENNLDVEIINYRQYQRENNTKITDYTITMNDWIFLCKTSTNVSSQEIYDVVNAVYVSNMNNITSDFYYNSYTLFYEHRSESKESKWRFGYDYLIGSRSVLTKNYLNVKTISENTYTLETGKKFEIEEVKLSSSLVLHPQRFKSDESSDIIVNRIHNIVQSFNILLNDRRRVDLPPVVRGDDYNRYIQSMILQDMGDTEEYGVHVMMVLFYDVFVKFILKISQEQQWHREVSQIENKICPKVDFSTLTLNYSIIDPLDKKCDGVFRDEKSSKSGNVRVKCEAKDYESCFTFVRNSVERCNEIENRYLIISISLIGSFEHQHSRHANYLLIDLKNRLMTRIEPHGYGKNTFYPQKSIDCWIEDNLVNPINEDRSEEEQFAYINEDLNMGLYTEMLSKITIQSTDGNCMLVSSYLVILSILFPKYTITTLNRIVASNEPRIRFANYFYVMKDFLGEYYDQLKKMRSSYYPDDINRIKEGLITKYNLPK